jgi:hypothetical protein
MVDKKRWRKRREGEEIQKTRKGNKINESGQKIKEERGK